METTATSAKWNKKFNKCQYFHEYITQIFHIVLYNVQMINDASSSPITDFKTQAVVNNHLCKVLIGTGAKVMKLNGVQQIKCTTQNIESNHSTVQSSLVTFRKNSMPVVSLLWYVLEKNYDPIYAGNPA